MGMFGICSGELLWGAWVARIIYFCGMRGNKSALSENFNVEKLCSRVLSKESVLFVKQLSSVSESPFVGLGGNVCNLSLAR